MKNLTLAVMFLAALGSWSVSAQYAVCVQPPPNLTAWFTLDPVANGQQTPDIVNNVNALVNGSAVFGPGYVGQALTFDGSTVFVTAANSAQIDIATGDFSIDFWMRVDDPTVITAGGARVILDKRTSTNGYSIFLSNGRIGLQLADGTFDNYQPSTNSPSDNFWHYYAVTVQRGSSTGVQFYLDGQPITGTGNAALHAGSLSNISPLQLGKATTGSSANFKGTLDEVDLFKRALSAAEVMSIYNAGTAGKCQPAAASSLIISSVFFPAMTEGSLYTFNFTASGGQPPYLWSATGLPSWLTLSTAGVLSGTPPKGSGGSVSFNVTVVDAAKNTVSAPITFKINSGIVITPSQLPPATEAASYNATFTATGGNGNFTWSASGLPSWLTLSATGTLSGTPPLGSAGNYNISITAKDSAGLSGTLPVTLTVIPLPLIITTKSPLSSATEGVSFTTQLSATGGKTPYQWSGTGLPSWLSLDGTGKLSGTPPPKSAGAILFNASVTDSLGTKQSSDFVLPINSASGALTITSFPQLPQATVGTYYTQTLTASGGNPPYKWAEAFTPPGTTLSSAGVVSGTPTTPGDFAFTTTVADSAGAVAIKILKVTVAPVTLAIVTPAPIAAGVAGVPYSETFTAAGGKAPIRWTVADGSALPQGFTLSTDGVLSGTPSAVGTFPISLVAKDAANNLATATYQFTVAQSGGLDLSVGSLAFTAFTFGSNPPTQDIGLTATPVAAGAAFAQLPFSAKADAVWLTLTPNSGTTPGDIAVEVFPRLAPGDYSANITITSGNAAPKIVPVSLKVLPGQLSLAAAPTELHLYGTRSGTGILTASLHLTNTGSGSVAYTANAVDIPGATLTPSSGTVLPNVTATLTISVDTSSLAAGYYRGKIEVNWSSGEVSAMVTVQVNTKPKLFFSASGGTANATEGVGLIGPATRSFNMLSSDGSSIRYSAKVIGSAPWLTLNNTGGTVANGLPTAISYTIDPTGLTSNAYYARIRITSSDVLNPTQDYLVDLKVTPPDVVAPSLFPAGLAFVAAGASVPAAQTFQVYTNAGAAVPIQLGVNTQDGGTWLSAKSQSTTVSARSPALVQVTVNPAGLSKGFYRGTITTYEGGTSARSASVVLVVVPAATENSPDSATATTAGCTPAALTVVQTSLEGNFFLLAGFPGTVNARVLDNCGNGVANAAVDANFSNGDAPLSLRIADPVAGTYSGTWVPTRPVSGLTTMVTATAPGLTSSTVQIGGTAGPNAGPTLRGDGPLHIFYPRTGASLAPGTLLQIYGSGLGTTATTLVDIGGFSAPLLFVGDGQIDAQVPFDLVPGEYQFIASVGTALTDFRTLTVDPLTPGVAGFPDGHTIAQHAVDYSLITSDSPARPNEFVILYLSGLGPTVPPVATGAPSPLPPANVVPLPKVMLDGKEVVPSFAGLSPGIIGVYQINFMVPADARTGDLQLQVFQGSVPANTSLLPVAQ
ncbi:MAG TPA: putative Ig domain-containing protein [Bryobacteraceae bacterium]|nr:putative Ig domain-containing protein [Bryobacteraceae bacterium]